MDAAIVGSIDTGARPAPRPTARQVAAKFEALLLTQMLNAMQSTVEKSGLLESDSGDETYREMLNQAMSDEIARRGGLGLAEQIARQLEARQAAAGQAEPAGQAGAAEPAAPEPLPAEAGVPAARAQAAAACGAAVEGIPSDNLRLEDAP